MSLSFSIFFLDFFSPNVVYSRLQNMKICSKHFFFSVWSFATQPENQLKKRGIQKMMQIDFEDVHDVTGWSTEDVLLLHKKLPV